jgi:hypothetical protein
MGRMRKLDLDGVRSDFVNAVLGVTSLEILVEDAGPAALRPLTELLMLATVVLWEGFVNDLFVAYINRDSANLTKSIAAKIAEAVENKYGKIAAAATTVKLGPHLKKAAVESLLDHSGRNLAFASAAELIREGKRILPDDAAERLGKLTTSDRAIMDAWIAIRNYLAHRSRDAKKRMDGALRNPDLPAQLRRSQRRVSSVGTFLAARSPAGNTRAEFIFTRMRLLASRL